MRNGWWLGLILGLAGCGRTFTAPKVDEVQPPGPIAADLATVALAPNQVGELHLRGGVPPYAVGTLIDGGSDCGATLSDTRVTYAACLRPSLQDQILVRDADGGALAVPVTVGPAMQVQYPASSQQECSTVRVSITGGAPGYTLVVADGGPAAACDGGGAPLVLDQQGNITTFVFTVPAYDAAGANSYQLQILDSIELQKLHADQQPDPHNVAAFPLTVTATPAAVPPLTIAQVFNAAPGAAVALTWEPRARTPTFAFAPAGNSSGATLDGSGSYTAGLNPNTVDHIVVTEPSLPTGSQDVWVVVGNPSLPLPVSGSGALLAGDINGDGSTDLLVLSDPNGSSALPMTVIHGGSAGPTVQAPLNVTLPAQSNLIAIQLLDATGDGLDDLAITFQPATSGGGGGPGTTTGGGSIGGSTGGPTGGSTGGPTGGSTGGSGGGVCYGPLNKPWCSGNTPNLSDTTSFCKLDPFGNPSGCGENVTRTSDGGYLGSPTAVPFADGGGVALLFDTGEIDCLPNPDPSQGARPSVCSAAFVPVTDGFLTIPEWRCGPAGCGPGYGSRNGCSDPSGNGSWVCDVDHYPADGGPPAFTACSAMPNGDLACGPLTCHDLQNGSWDCGPNNCLPGAPGEFFCVDNACGTPDGGPYAECGNGCRVCNGISGGTSGTGGTGGSTGAGTTTGNPGPQPTPPRDVTEIFAAVPGGGFMDIGGVAGDGRPLLEAPGVLDFPRGQRLAAERFGGAIFFNDAGQVTVPDFGSDFPMELARAGSTPLVAAATTFIGTGQLYEIFGADAGPWTALATDRLSSLVGLVDLDGAGAGQQGQSVFFIDPSGTKLVVENADGAPCFGFETMIDLPLKPGEQVGTQLPLAAVRGIAISLQQSGGVISGRWVLVRRGPSCGLQIDPWSAVGLPPLDLVETRAISLASGDFNADGVPDLAVAGLDSLQLFAGNMAGRYGQGDSYAVPSPLNGLSSLQTANGGLVAGVQLLDGTVQIFGATTNHAPGDGGPTSALAYLGSWSVDDSTTLGGTLRSSGLLTLQVNSSSHQLDLVLHPDPTRPDDGGSAPLGFTVASTAANVASPFSAVPNDPDRVWVVLQDPSGQTIEAVRATTASTGVALDQHQQVDTRAQRLIAFQAVEDGGLELLQLDTDAGFQLADATGARQRLIAASTLTPPCSDESSGVFIPGTSLLLLRGGACPGGNQNGTGGPDSGATVCCNSNDLGYVVYDLGTQRIEPAYGLEPSKPRNARALPLPDGGEAVVVTGFGRVGLSGIIHTALGDGGSGWVLDPQLQSSEHILDLVDYPQPAGAAPRLIGASVGPASVQVISR